MSADESVRLDRDLAADAQRVAAQAGLSLEAYVRALVQDAIEVRTVSKGAQEGAEQAPP